MVIVLEGERPKSLNKYWAGMHWSKRSAEKNRVRAVVLESLSSDAKMFHKPVYVAIHAYFDKKPLDADNIVAKPYIDALRGRVIQDDDMGFIEGVALYPYIDKERPRIEIEIVIARV